MKHFLVILICTWLLAGTALAQDNQKKNEKDTLEIKTEEDSVEYSLIFDDPRFRPWLISNARPKEFYTLSYYHNWNVRYVNSWNIKVNSSDRLPLMYYINYGQFEEYPLEIEWELFWYFKYIESLYGRGFLYP